MFELVKKLFRKKQERSLILKDSNGQPVFLISYDDNKGEIDIKLERPLNLMVTGNVCTLVDGEFDFATMGDMRIDTFLSNLFMNSYNSKPIKKMPRSIEKQVELEQLRQDNIKFLESLEEEDEHDCTCNEKEK